MEKKLDIIRQYMERRNKWEYEILEKFDADVKRNGYVHTIKWMGEKVMKAEMLIQKRNELLKILSNKEMTVEQVPNAIEEEKTNLLQYLIDFTPWRHNSTDMMSNIENMVKADVIAQFVKELEELTEIIKELK